MTLNLPGHPTAPPVSCPAHSPTTDAVPTLYGPDFTADPDATYRRLRQHGPASWVELAPGVTAILITSYEAALEVLRSPYFVKDARRWRDLADGRIPTDNQVLPMMAWRPSLLFADGERHLRLRASVDDALARVDAHRLRAYVQHAALNLIRDFGPAGQADLVAQYADRLPTLVFGRLFGAPEDLVHRMAVACDQMIDAEPDTAQRGSEDLAACLAQLITHKRRTPGADLTSWLIEHPTSLSDNELIHQHVVLIGAGTVPESAWIATATMLLLTDDRFAASLTGGSLTLGDALNEVLWTRSPMSNFCFHYTTKDGGYWLRDTTGASITIPPGVPVLISHQAANTDPALDPARGHREANHAHLAFSAGPHVCPAQDQAGLIAEAAIETLLDQLPDLQLAIDPDEFAWRPGPFHRSLTQLPVRFPPLPADRVPVPADLTDTLPGDSSWTSASTTSTSPAATSTPKPPTSARAARPRRWRSPVAWWRGR